MHYSCLMIEDDELLAQVVCKYFNIFNLKTTYVTNAEIGLSFLQYNSVDLILLNINLKNQNKLELIELFHQKTNNPILFINERQRDAKMLLPENIGIDDYIQKPFLINALFKKANAIIK